MNERINDLRLEAGIGRLHEVPYMVAVNKEGELIEPLEGLQKFAQLIVAECLGIVDDAERGGSNEIWDNAVKFIRRDLQEHFGVE